jgi:hypothetical protein
MLAAMLRARFGDDPRIDDLAATLSARLHEHAIARVMHATTLDDLTTTSPS